MSKSVRSIPRDRTPQWKLDLMILKDQLQEDEDNGVTYVERDKLSSRPLLFGVKEYDTLHPEETLRLFCGDIRDMISRYEGNKLRLEELENEMQDLLHFIEMTGDKNANAGFKLYKRLAEVRRERRTCKNELDLLHPIYENFKDTDLLNILTRIQGSCGAAKRQIDGRAYSVRTDVLDPFLK